MTQNGVHDLIARRLPELRKSRGFSSAEKLAEAMTAVGIPWDRSIVANFENRRRAGLSVEELLALAYVLNIAPVHLLVPTEDENSRYPVVPTSAVRSGRARQWIRGLFPLPSTDKRLFFSSVPVQEWVPHNGFEAFPGSVLVEHEFAQEMSKRDLRGDLRYEDEGEVPTDGR